MKEQFFKKYRLRLFVVILALGIYLQFVILGGANPWSAVAAYLTPARVAVEPIVPIHRPAFQTGMVFPQWNTSAYSTQDKNWSTGLKGIQTQTGARWVEMTVNFYQSSLTSTTVRTTEKTPTPEAFAQGIRTARAMHYHVFVVPLLTVEGTTPTGTPLWCGDIRFTTTAEAQQWFDSYWSVFKPYVAAAEAAGAEQLAIGTEYENLQFVVPSVWEHLIGQVHNTFSGMLTYDMNWSSVAIPIQAWMHDPRLSYIGVSTYFPLTTVRQRLDPNAVPMLWRAKIKDQLDALARRVGKPVLISEIGYRNSADALYNPWEKDTHAVVDDGQQAAAYRAALMNIADDPAITGIFFWAWSFQWFEPNQRAAAGVLLQWYTVKLL